MMAQWPFAQWGLDILGPFPLRTRQMKFLVVKIDYQQRSHNRMLRTSFGRTLYVGLGCLGYWFLIMDDNLITRFSGTSASTLESRIISPYPPTPKQMVKQKWQTNSCWKSSKLSFRAKGVWSDELPWVFWAYGTTVTTPTRETPFKLAYGSEAVIPVEVDMVNHRVMKY